jgi:hypothetical protein
MGTSTTPHNPEAGIIASGGDCFHMLLGYVVVDRQVARAGVPPQRLPLVLHIPDRGAHRALRQHVRLLCVQPRLEVLQDRDRPLLTDPQADRGACRFIAVRWQLGDLGLDVAFDRVELSIIGQGHGRSRRIRGLRLDELPPRVRIATHLDDVAAGIDAVVAAEGIGESVSLKRGEIREFQGQRPVTRWVYPNGTSIA